MQVGRLSRHPTHRLRALLCCDTCKSVKYADSMRRECLHSRRPYGICAALAAQTSSSAKTRYSGSEQNCSRRPYGIGAAYSGANSLRIKACGAKITLIKKYI